MLLSSQMLGKYGRSAELIGSSEVAPAVSLKGLPWPSAPRKGSSAPEEAGADAIYTAESVLKGLTSIEMLTTSFIALRYSKTSMDFGIL